MSMLISQRIWEVDDDFTNIMSPHHCQLSDTVINTGLTKIKDSWHKHIGIVDVWQTKWWSNYQCKFCF